MGCGSGVSAARLRPISVAARIVIALAIPMPLKAVSCARVCLPKVVRLLPTEANMRLLKATALSLAAPEPMRMAKSSALLYFVAKFDFRRIVFLGFQSRNYDAGS